MYGYVNETVILSEFIKIIILEQIKKSKIKSNNC